jgi:hypothetical protein
MSASGGGGSSSSGGGGGTAPQGYGVGIPPPTSMADMMSRLKLSAFGPPGNKRKGSSKEPGDPTSLALHRGAVQWQRVRRSRRRRYCSAVAQLFLQRRGRRGGAALFATPRPTRRRSSFCNAEADAAGAALFATPRPARAGAQLLLQRHGRRGGAALFAAPRPARRGQLFLQRRGRHARGRSYRLNPAAATQHEVGLLFVFLSVFFPPHPLIHAHLTTFAAANPGALIVGLRAL